MPHFKHTLSFVLVFLLASHSWSVIDPSEAPLNRQNLLQAVNDADVTKLDDFPGTLPDGVLINFVLKHGVLLRGPRGHEVERDVSQSSDPELPRVILFDERSGTSVSYNGGDTNRDGQLQTHGDRLDILTFNHQAKTFHLDAITFENHVAGMVRYDDLAQYVQKDQCVRCHGPHQRPIFSMYPDWPTFYGSDNDELLDRDKQQQVDEYRNYTDFLANAGQTNPRYTTLYSEDRLQKYFSRSLRWYPSFPYRPNLSGNIEDPSRAFAYRPGLRMGILYNRLTSQQIAQMIKTHPHYQEFGGYFLFNLLQCRWDSSSKARRWLSKVGSEVLGETAKTREGRLLNYRQNLSIFGLRVNDVDIRFSYNHSGYQENDANDMAEHVVDVGYINERYFNSYFDGSATMDELLSYQLYQDLVARGQLRPVNLTPRSLVAKYGRRTQRMALDRLFFEQMDEFSQWIPIRYPRSLASAHHREGYPTRFQQQHNRLCQALEARL